MGGWKGIRTAYTPFFFFPLYFSTLSMLRIKKKMPKTQAIEIKTIIIALSLNEGVPTMGNSLKCLLYSYLVDQLLTTYETITGNYSTSACYFETTVRVIC